MAKNLAPEEVQSVLNSGEFGALLGAVEDAHLECKGAPYQVDQGDLAKQELSKDVSAIANLSARLVRAGGHILIGAQTRTSPEHHGDVIVAVNPFPQGMLNPADYHKIIESWVVSRIDGLRIVWYGSSDDRTRGIVGITIRPQRHELWPFLVRKVVDEESGKIIGNLIGYYERRGDGIVAYTAEDIQRIMRDGLRFDTVLEPRFEAIEKRLQGIEEGQTAASPKQPPSPSQSLQLYRQRRDELISVVGLGESAAFALTSAPAESVSIPGLFRGGHPIVELLRNPPQLRAGGWTPRIGEPEILRGTVRRALGRTAALDCYPDGTVIFVAAADSFLCWWGSHGNGPPRVNPMALVESTYTFSDLVHRIYSTHAEPRPSEIELGLSLYRMDAGGTPRVLLPDGIKSVWFRFPREPFLRLPPESNCEFSERVSGDWTPGQAAYRLVRDVYTWYGFEEDVIPYVAEQESGHVISAEKILAEGE
jgi:hypothetical protein